MQSFFDPEVAAAFRPHDVRIDCKYRARTATTRLAILMFNPLQMVRETAPNDWLRHEMGSDWKASVPREKSTSLYVGGHIRSHLEHGIINRTHALGF